MTTHVKVLAVLYIVFGACSILLAFGMSAILGTLAALIGASGDQDAAVGATVLGLTGAAMSAFFFVTGLPGIIVGIGLLKLKRWARIGGIVLSAICLISFPFGTILGIYGLWVLFHKDTEALLQS